MPTILKITLTVCLFLFLVGSASAADFIGTWKGAIQIPGSPLEVEVTIDTAETGELAGDIDIPAQNTKDQALKDIAADGSTISFVITTVPGDPTFDGSLSDDGDTLSGEFRQGGAAFPFMLTRFDVAAAEAEKAALEAKLNEIRTFIDSTMAYWNVPGMGLGLVVDDSVVMLEGYGYRDVENEVPVDEHTVFAIGSSTKAFTTMLLGMLVDDGLIAWDEPVRTYLPTFDMDDDFAAERMTPMDLVTHRSGLPRHDLMWYNSTATREEMFNRLPYLEPNEDFRATFQYQNLMYMTAGYLAGQVVGSTWEELIDKRIFTPLGMNESVTSIQGLIDSPNRALGYRWHNDTLEQMDYRGIDALGPAGTINSTIGDMVQWVRLHLSDGELDGAKLISGEQLSLMHRMHMPIPGGMSAEMPVNGYGLGWFIRPYRGHAVSHHGGNIDGFTALVHLLPNDNIGMVILTNMNTTPYTTIMARTIADIMLEIEPMGWHDRIKERHESDERVGEEKKDPERIEGTKPSHDLEDYVGIYSNKGYGNAEVTREKKQLRLTYNNIPLELKHWHYDVFRGTNDLFPDVGFMVTFRTNERGEIASFLAPLELSVDDIEFERQPAREWYTTEYLETYTGTYELADQSVTFRIRADSILTASITNQPTFELEPFDKHAFSLQGLTGYSVKFKDIDDGKARVAEFHQPNGVFAARRMDDVDENE